MTFYKTLLAFTIALSVFSSNVFSMRNGDNPFLSEDSDHSSISVSPREDANEILPEESLPPSTPILLERKEKSCSHWGLTRWVYGIGEYLQRSLCFAESLDCCFDKRDPERKYIIREERSRWEIEHGQEARVRASSDCAFIHALSDREEAFHECIRNCCLIPCCPLATLTHLCCLPCACFEHSKKQEENTLRSPPIYTADTRTQEERAEGRRASAIESLMQTHRNCYRYTCLVGNSSSCTYGSQSYDEIEARLFPK